MKRFLVFCILLYTLPVYSISSYSASYNLFTETDLGYIKFGSAKYELLLTNNVYVFNSKAITDKLWRTIHDYAVDETSIGLIENDKLIGNYYKITEKIDNLISDNYEVNINPNEGYVSLNNEIIWEIKSVDEEAAELEKLADSQLILQAIDSGYADKIEFGGSKAFDPTVPSYEKDLANKEELIKILVEPEKGNAHIVDALSIYINIAEDIQKNSDKKVFSYQIVDKKGVNQREFNVEGLETIIIDHKEFETIRIACPELRLIINFSKEHNYVPVLINKINGKNKYRLTLKDYTQKS